MGEALHVAAPRVRQTSDGSVVSSVISLPGHSGQELWIRFRGATPVGRVDPFVVMALLPAMKLKVPLQCDSPVSRTLMESGLSRAQRIHRIWREDPYVQAHQRIHEVSVEAPIAEDLVGGADVGLFYSAGIDSNYSLLEHRDEISHLLFIEDFEERFPPDQAEKAAASVTNVARALGMHPVFVETNAKSVFQGLVSWFLPA